MVRANMLSDASSFSGNHVRFADEVQQGRFAVVDMAHDDNNRRTICDANSRADQVVTGFVWHISKDIYSTIKIGNNKIS